MAAPAYGIEPRDSGTWLVLRGRSGTVELLLEFEHPKHALIIAEVRQALLHEGTAHPSQPAACLTPEDYDQIIEGIQEFIIAGNNEVAAIWTPYIEKLRVAQMRRCDGHLGARGGE
jgi:hypothetical protein